MDKKTLSNVEKQKAFRDRQKPYHRVSVRIRDLEEKLYDLHDALVVLLNEIENLKE